MMYDRTEEEQKERAALQAVLQELHAIAAAVLPYLQPGPWSLDERASFWQEDADGWPRRKKGDLREPEIIKDGLRLEFSRTRDRPARLQICGVLPRYSDGRWFSFSGYEEAADLTRTITVAMDKEPAKIAADISRRLLPSYTKACEGARAKIAADEGEESRRRATIQAVAKIAGSPVRERDLQMNICPVFYVGGARVEVRHSTTIHLEADLRSPEELEAIKPYLRERNT